MLCQSQNHTALGDPQGPQPNSIPSGPVGRGSRSPAGVGSCEDPSMWPRIPWPPAPQLDSPTSSSPPRGQAPWSCMQLLSRRTGQENVRVDRPMRDPLATASGRSSLPPRELGGRGEGFERNETLASRGSFAACLRSSMQVQCWVWGTVVLLHSILHLGIPGRGFSFSDLFDVRDVVISGSPRKPKRSKRRCLSAGPANPI